MSVSSNEASLSTKLSPNYFGYKPTDWP